MLLLLLRRALLLLLAVLLCHCAAAAEGGSPDPLGPAGPGFVLRAVWPSSAPNIGGWPIELHGEGFTPDPVVLINDVPAEQVSWISPTLLRAVLPLLPGTLGPVPIAVRLPDGSQTVRRDLFSFAGTQLDFETVPYTIGGEPRALAAADLSGDGKQDLAVVLDEGIGLLLGDGANRFALSRVSLPIANAGSRCLSGDWNRDGAVDLAVRAPGGVKIYFNDGKGGFREGQLLGPTSSFASVVAGDFDGDNIPDLALVDSSSRVITVWELASDGSFAAPSQLTFPGNLGEVASADLDGDGLSDLIIMESGYRKLRVYFGKPGAGGFITGPISATGSFDLERLVTGDFDGDGKLDLAALSSYNLVILSGDGRGSFSLPVTIQTLTPDVVLASGDLNRDGRTDIVTGRSVFLSLGGGSFFSRSLVVPGSLRGITLHDLDLDGSLDALLVTTQGVSIFQGDGQGGLTPLRVLFGPRSLGSGTTADLDGDGHLDAVWTDSSGTSSTGLLFTYGDGRGGISRFDFLSGGTGGAVQAADVNEDRLPDLITGTSTGTPYLWLAKSPGEYSAPAPVPGSSAGSFSMVDMDADGHVDLLQFGTSIRWLRGNGSGGFQLAAETLTRGEPRTRAIVDLNADGFLDVVAIGSGGASSGLDIYVNDRSGRLKLGQTASGYTNGRLLTGDFNRDGKQDVLGIDSRGVSFWAGDGKGGLMPSRESALSSINEALTAVFDLNRDGFLDLVGYGASFLGDGLGRFVPYGSPTAVSGFAVSGDFDEDGAPDLIRIGSSYTTSRHRMEFLLNRAR